jgi:hypothetical protein
MTAISNSRPGDGRCSETQAAIAGKYKTGDT